MSASAIVTDEELGSELQNMTNSVVHIDRSFLFFIYHVKALKEMTGGRRGLDNFKRELDGILPQLEELHKVFISYFPIRVRLTKIYL